MRSLLVGFIKRRLFELIKSDQQAVAFCAPSDPIGQSLILWGHYEGQIIADLARIIAERLPESRQLAMLDVGANIGTHSVGLAHLFSRVIAFEPNPAVGLVATANVRAAGLSNVEILACGLSDRRASATLYVHKGIYSYGSISQGPAPEVEIQLEVGDSIVREKSLKVGLIKIDVESHEPFVLRGLRETLEEHSPLVAFEGVDLSAARQAVKILRDSGYREFLGLGRIAGSLRQYWDAARRRHFKLEDHGQMIDGTRYVSIVAIK